MPENKRNRIQFRIIASCLWCEKEIPISENIKDKMLCSKKCLKELRTAIEKQHGKGSCGYDMEDVVCPKTSK